MPGRPFPKGVSPNPGGRPKVIGHVRDLARKYTADAVRTLRSVMANPKSPPAARVAAATALLDRGFGRPGAGSVQFTLPELRSASDAAPAMKEIAKAATAGDLTPAEAMNLARLIEIYVKAIEATEFERRLDALERRQNFEGHDEQEGQAEQTRKS
jgi:hypothetical protein